MSAFICNLDDRAQAMLINLNAKARGNLDARTAKLPKASQVRIRREGLCPQSLLRRGELTVQ